MSEPRYYTVFGSDHRPHASGSAIIMHLRSDDGRERRVAVPWQTFNDRDWRQGRAVVDAILATAGRRGIMLTSELHGIRFPARLTRDRLTVNGEGCRLVAPLTDRG